MLYVWSDEKYGHTQVVLPNTIFYSRGLVRDQNNQKEAEMYPLFEEYCIGANIRINNQLLEYIEAY